MTPNAADPLSREVALSLGGCLLQGVLSERVMAMCDTQARCDTLVGTQHRTSLASHQRCLLPSPAPGGPELRVKALHLQFFVAS